MLIRFLDRIADVVGQTIKWFVFFMVIVTFGIVVLRYWFSTGSIAVQESVMYAHAMVFMLGAAFTLRHDQHVRVDIFYQKMKPRTKAWVDLSGTLLFLFPICAYMIWSSWGYVLSSWELKEGSREAGGLPFVYLLKTNIVIMSCLLVTQGFSEVLKALSIIIGANTRENSKQIVEG